MGSWWLAGVDVDLRIFVRHDAEVLLTCEDTNSMYRYMTFSHPNAESSDAG